MIDIIFNLNNVGLNYFSICMENNRGLIFIILFLYIDNLNIVVYMVCFFWFFFCMICLGFLYKSVIYILVFCVIILFIFLLGIIVWV